LLTNFVIYDDRGFFRAVELNSLCVGNEAGHLLGGYISSVIEEYSTLLEYRIFAI